MIADAAMRATWRSIKLAGNTPLHAHGNAVDLHALVQRSSEVILPIFVRRRFNEKPYCSVPVARHKIAQAHFKLPFGMTPGSMNVASEKFITTKKVMTPCRAGTHKPHRET